MERGSYREHYNGNCPLYTKRHMMSTPSDMSFSMENNWRYKYYGPPILNWNSEQEYVDYHFIWLIYANFGVLLSVDKLAVAA